jgi:hypothetical protein
MGNSQSEGEKALDNTLAAQAGQMAPTTEQITELWDAYDKNKDGILVSFAALHEGGGVPSFGTAAASLSFKPVRSHVVAGLPGAP